MSRRIHFKLIFLNVIPIVFRLALLFIFLIVRTVNNEPIVLRIIRLFWAISLLAEPIYISTINYDVLTKNIVSFFKYFNMVIGIAIFTELICAIIISITNCSVIEYSRYTTVNVVLMDNLRYKLFFALISLAIGYIVKIIAIVKSK